MKNFKEISLGLLILFTFISLISFSQETYPFIENKGQLPTKVLSKVKVPSGAIFIEKGKFTYTFYNGRKLTEIHDLKTNDHQIEAHSFTSEFLNKNKNIEVILEEESEYFENFYIKNNFINNVHFHKNVIQKNIYNGIDLKMYYSKNNLKYDLIISPNTSPKKIKIKYTGHDQIYLKNGNISIITSVNIVTEIAPFAYQLINGVQKKIECHYKLKRDILSFSFPDGYDTNKELIIDPTLIFSTYSGSISDNFGYTATYDNDGFLYSGSTVFGVGYPITLGAYQINFANILGGTDIGITKYDTTGTYRIYSTYLGGSASELPHSMIVNNLNELFVFGTTGSNDFPTTSGSFQQEFKGGNGFSPSGLGVSFPNGSDIIVSRLSALGGDLLASTYLGGSGNDGLNTSPKLKKNYADEVRGEIDIDKNNNIYLATCTYSDDFPTTNTFQQYNSGNQEACIIKMDNQLSTIIWSSYLGGSKDDAIYSLAIDSNDNVFVTGGTNSDNFPVTPNTFNTTFLDSLNADAFISHISSDGNTLINSSFFGSEYYDQSYFVELNSKEEVYIFGQTKAIGNTLIQNSNFFTINASQFIAIFSNNLQQVLRSTVIGTGKGTPDISPTAFLVDVCNNIYISGWGSGTGNGPLSTMNMPISSNAFDSITDGNDFYIMVIDDLLNNLIYGAYFGGSQSAEHVDGGTSRFDKKGVIYQSVCAGCGGNNDFPISPNPGAVSMTNNSSNCNNGVFKFDFNFPIVLADFDAPWISCIKNIDFTNQSTSPINTTYFWDFGDGNTSNQNNPTHQYLLPGIYNITLISSSLNACNLSDTITKQVYILSNSSTNIQEINICKNESTQIGIVPISNQTIDYLWFPSNGLSNINISNPIVNINTTTNYQLLISDGNCTDTLYQLIIVDSLSINTLNDTTFCNTPILISPNTSGTVNTIQWSNYSNFSDTISSNNNFLTNNIGKYYIKITNNFCTEIDSVEVLNDNIIIDLSGITEICLGDSIFIKVDDYSPFIPITQYKWDTEFSPDFNTDSSSLVAFPSSSSWAIVRATNILGCYVLDSIYVEVNNYPNYNSFQSTSYTIFLGEETTLNISTTDNVIWFNNDTIQNIVIHPEYSGWYGIQIYNDYCKISDSIYIEVKDVFCDISNILIPTAFSPNQDNNNEYYRVIDEDGIITSYKLEIFNRYGEKVFSSEKKKKKWDGYYKDELLATQVFDYYLKIECVSEKTLYKKGNITLIR